MRRLLAVFLPIAAFGCSLSVLSSDRLPAPAPQTPVPQTSVQINVGELSRSQIEGGCGMTLWKPDRAPREQQFLLFSGLNGSMQMEIDGKVVTFDRIQSSGEEFYGQRTFQTYRSQDGALTVNVEVTLGKPGEIESVAIPTGTIRINQNGQEITLPATGDAGC